MPPLRIAYVASEITPFAKTGGLADVAEALPRAIASLGHEVRVFVPLYGAVDREAHGLELELEAETFALYRATILRSQVPVYFVDGPAYFAREAIYTNDADEPQRFSFFCRAAIESCQRLGFSPDIVHVNDWQSALVPLLLGTSYAWDRLFEQTKTLLTIHNIGYQGVFPYGAADALGLDDPSLFDEHDRANGVVNFLKTGLRHADHLSTVSPTYAREIQSEEHGFGLDGLLRARSDDLVGILNGVDYDEWNPEHDRFIPVQYTPETIARKAENKAALASQVGLDVAENVPLAGMVTRLSAQKGIELLPEVLSPLLERRQLALVVLGSGELAYESYFTSLQTQFPGRVCFYRGFKNELAHWIEAGADLFLMPSRYEPCGLNQMYSLKYGTIPVVRNTGGLADSVTHFDPKSGEGTGAVFEHYTPEGVLWGIQAALGWYRDEALWSRLRANAMAQDFSWSGQAERYVGIYRKLLIH